MKEGELARVINQYDDPEELITDIADLLEIRAKHGEARNKEVNDPIIKMLAERDRQWSTSLKTLIDEGGLLIN